jgi:hypothetical protein
MPLSLEKATGYPDSNRPSLSANMRDLLASESCTISETKRDLLAAERRTLSATKMDFSWLMRDAQETKRDYSWLLRVHSQQPRVIPLGC